MSTKKPSHLGRPLEQLGARLREQRTQSGLSQEDFAAAARIPLSTYKKYEGGRRLPGAEALRGLAEIGVDLMEVLGGETRVLYEMKTPTPTASEPATGYAYIPLLDVRARGGPRGSIVEGDEQPTDALAFKEDWIRHELHAKPADLRLIYVEGDSMEPDLRAGDIILIDHTDTSARREGIYVIRMDGALLVKILQRLPGGVIKVLSRNENYEPFSVTVADMEQAAAPDKFTVVGRVVWACRRY